MYEHNGYMYYSQLRNKVTKSEIYVCTHLINRIKEHRHNKIKARQINKFECLVSKGKSGYFDNFTRHNNSAIFNNTDQNSLSRHSSQSNHFNNSTSNTAPTKAASMVPSTTDPAPTNLAPTAPSMGDNNINNNNQCKWVIKLTNTPLTTVQQTHLARGPNFAIVHKYPLQRSLHPNSLTEKWKSSDLIQVGS